VKKRSLGYLLTYMWEDKNMLCYTCCTLDSGIRFLVRVRFRVVLALELGLYMCYGLG
jgi:hypothetical protein